MILEFFRVFRTVTSVAASADPVSLRIPAMNEAADRLSRVIAKVV
jgi:hypothetical protein